MVFLAQCCGGEIHHAQAAVVDFIVGDFREFGGGGIFLGVGGVDAVHAGSLEHHVGLNLDGAEGRAGVGCEERIAGAAGDDGHFAAFEGVDGFPFRVLFTDGEHVYGREHPCRLAYVGKGRAEGERVDDGCEHAHLVAHHAVEAFCSAAEAAEDVASADYDGNLDPAGHDILDLLGIGTEAFLVDAVALMSHERFTAQFEKYSCIFCPHFSMMF